MGIGGMYLDEKEVYEVCNSVDGFIAERLAESIIHRFHTICWRLTMEYCRLVVLAFTEGAERYKKYCTKE